MTPKEQSGGSENLGQLSAEALQDQACERLEKKLEGIFEILVKLK